jgi:hypothetical protein
MARYTIGTGMGGTPQIMTTTYKTLLGLTSPSTVRRAYVYHFMMGPDGAPGDTTMVYKLDRQTTVGTGTAVTPHAIDPADGASTLVGTANHTAEPTVTDNTEMFEIACNQRSAFQWMASQNAELVVPATNLNGVGLRAKSPTYILTMVANLHFYD